MNEKQEHSTSQLNIEYPLTTAKQTMGGSPGDVSEDPVT